MGISNVGYTNDRYARFGDQKKHAVCPTDDDAHDQATRTTTANAMTKREEHTRPGLGV